MFHLKLFDSSVLCVIGDNFDVLVLEKSILKKPENRDCTIAPPGPGLIMAEIDLDRPAAARIRKATFDRLSDLDEAARTIKNGRNVTSHSSSDR